jgi:cytosine permease
VAPTVTASGIFQRLDNLNEFERQPVTAERLHGGSYFAAVSAGEHIAATEFVIGALFVGLGARAFDVIVGLLLGNFLAVLSWALVCVPIAFQTRLTLYWYLRKIAGPVVTFLYNILNGLLYAVLAGAMITVSASAVRIPLGIGPQVKPYPDDARFVLLVLGIGAVVVTLAILGFRRLADFSTVCWPWMVAVFVAGGLVVLPMLGPTHSLTSLWLVADQQIWTGRAAAPDAAEAATAPSAPAPGPVSENPAAPSVSMPGPAAAKPGGPPGPIAGPAPFDMAAAEAAEKARAASAEKPAGGLGFWHVAAFAWICCLAMHLGLSDMALFRFARRPWYGLYSAVGMYLGHYVSWICAGIMGVAAARALGQPLSSLDSGAIAFSALGAMGAMAVVAAGWTTANPTLYRAGLALQAVTPGWPRWAVTLGVGAVTTVVACFPFVFTRLLDFVAIYGVLLLPIGAIVVTEHWIFPRIGLTQFWNARKGNLVNWPALVSWLTAVALAAACWVSQVFFEREIIHPFFLVVPVWIITTVLYTVLAAMAGARQTLPELEDEPQTDRLPAPAPSDATVAAPAGLSPAQSRLYWFSGILAVACLAMIVGFAWAVFSHVMLPEEYRQHLLYLTLAYFAAAVVWLRQRNRRSACSGRVRE